MGDGGTELESETSDGDGGPLWWWLDRLVGDSRPPDVGERDGRTSWGLLEAKSVVMTVMDGMLWSSSTLDMSKMGGESISSSTVSW